MTGGTTEPGSRALAALDASGLAYRVIRHGPVRSLAEAALARGVQPAEDATVALEATGFERGTITPFGSTTAWPVIADERLAGHEVTLGAGEHGVAVAVDAGAAITALGTTVADISDPESAP